MYLTERILHNTGFEIKKTDGLAALMINFLLFQFTLGMVATFGVLFVYQLSETFLEGIVFVTAFFGFQRVVVALIVPMVGHLTARIGYRWMMVAGMLALAIKLYLLSLVTATTSSPLIAAGVLGGFAIAAYYLSYHALFLDDNNDKRIGEQYGALEVLGRVSLVLSPFVAGLLIDNYGFSVMFMVAMFIMLLSAIPLFLMKSHDRHVEKFNSKEIWKFVTTRKKTTTSMFFWQFTDGIQAFFWPIFLFLILGSYTYFGIVASLVMIANAVAIYLAGKKYDKRRARKMFYGSSVLVSLTWIGRLLATTPITVVFYESLNRLFSPFWWMKIRRQELLKGEQIDSLVFGAAHELVVSFAYLAAIAVGFVLLLMSKGNWTWLIIPTVGGTLISTWVLRRK